MAFLGVAWKTRIPLFLKILNGVLLITQSFLLAVICSHWYFFVFYIILVSILAIVGEMALIKKDQRLLYAYGIYLAIYLCWSAGMIMGMILGLTMFGSSTDDNINAGDSDPTPTSSVDTNQIGFALSRTIVGMILALITIILTLINLRLLFMLLVAMKRQRRGSVPIVQYVTRLPGAPPQYTDSMPNTPLPSPTVPPPTIDFEEEELPPKEDRSESLPPAYSQSDPLPPTEPEGYGTFQRTENNETPIL